MYILCRGKWMAGGRQRERWRDLTANRNEIFVMHAYKIVNINIFDCDYFHFSDETMHLSSVKHLTFSYGCMCVCVKVHCSYKYPHTHTYMEMHGCRYLIFIWAHVQTCTVPIPSSMCQGPSVPERERGGSITHQLPDDGEDGMTSKVTPKQCRRSEINACSLRRIDEWQCFFPLDKWYAISAEKTTKCKWKCQHFKLFPFTGVCGYEVGWIVDSGYLYLYWY